MKRTLYFRHDYNARNDPKLQDVMSTHGVAGIGIYWCIIEVLYEQGGMLPMKTCNTIAFSLHTQSGIVESVVKDFGLFQYDDECFWSDSVKSRVVSFNSVSEKRKAAALTRWQAATAEQHDEPTTEVQTQVEPPPQEPPKEQPKRKCFIPPTVEEVREYIQLKGYPIDAETFVAFYESKGWMIGKNKMKSWQMALVTWMKQRNNGGYRQTRSATTRNCNDEWK